MSRPSGSGTVPSTRMSSVRQLTSSPPLPEIAAVSALRRPFWPQVRTGEKWSEVGHLVLELVGELLLGLGDLPREELPGPQVLLGPVALEHLPGDGDLVDLGRPVGDAHHR